MKLFFILIFYSFFFKKTESITVFKFETSKPCENNKKLPAIILSINTYNINRKVCTEGEVDLKETLAGPIMMETQLQRCSEQLSQCSSYPSLKNQNICNEFNSTFLGPDLLPRISPSLTCPIKQGRYIFNKTLADFTRLSNLNLIPGRYKAKSVASHMKNGKLRQILCWTSIIRVSAFNSRKN